MGRLALAFFQHVMKAYYQEKETRLHFCKYVIHLVLHLEQSLRDCGPLSLVGQWCMENFVGDTNRRCNANTMFAESVAENLKIQSAARLYSLQHDIHINFLDDEPKPASPNLFFTSEDPKHKGYCFKHPKRILSMADAEIMVQIPLMKLLTSHYELEDGMSHQDAKRFVQDNNGLVIWSRLYDELGKGLYRSFTFNKEPGTRDCCYFSGRFENDEGGEDVYYGKALFFIEHPTPLGSRMLLAAAWVTRGLHVGEQKQVYANYRCRDKRLFRNARVESVHCMSHPIMVMEVDKTMPTGRMVTRTYFIDERREESNLLKSNSPSQRHSSRRSVLKGISKRHR